MREVVDTYKVYDFKELSEEAKKKALLRYWGINIEHDWWEYTYEDIKNHLDIEVTGFDLNRGGDVDFDFKCEDITHSFLKGLHIMCFKSKVHSNYLIELTEEYLSEFDKLYEDEEVDMSIDEIQYKLYGKSCEIKAQLGDAILKTLREEYEYLTSEESIIETFEANEYEFTEDGAIY